MDTEGFKAETVADELMAEEKVSKAKVAAKKAKKQKKQPAAEQYDFNEAFGQQAAVT